MLPVTLPRSQLFACAALILSGCVTAPTGPEVDPEDYLDALAQRARSEATVLIGDGCVISDQPGRDDIVIRDASIQIGKAAADGAGRGAAHAAPRQEGADVLGLQGGEVVEGRRIAEMTGEEDAELADVALVGIERVGGEPPLARQVGEPAADAAGKVGLHDQDRIGHCPRFVGPRNRARPVLVLQAICGRPIKNRLGRPTDQTMVWPVFFQSDRNWSRPLSVSGCSTSLWMVDGGMVATSAPASAQSRTWLEVRNEAASSWVVSSG